ncbi:MAG: portal protein [Victivallaceae bacterium]|nr:portal protein [Victivallaceae bacterium]
MTSHTASEICANFERLAGERANLSHTYEKCRAYASPSKYGAMFKGDDAGRVKGETPKPPRIVTDFFTECLFVFSRGIQSNLCPSSTRWFSIGATKTADAGEEVKNFLTEASQRFYDLLYSSSNFPSEFAETVEDAGCLGTFCMSCTAGENKAFRFENHDMQNVFVEASRRGELDTVYVTCSMSALQIVNFFNQEGDNIPAKIKELAANPSIEKSGQIFHVIHMVEPNRNRVFSSEGKPEPGSLNKAFVSAWVVKEEKAIVRRGGFDRSPYVVGRIDNPVDGTYSDSPMMRCLRTAKELNRVWRSYGDAIEAAVRPSVMVDISGYNGVMPEVYLEPGVVNTYDSHNKQVNPPQFYTPPVNFAAGKEMIDKLERRGYNFFYVDLFNIITNLNTSEGRQRTAYEIQQLVSEKNSMILPVIARFIDEFLSPLLRIGFFSALERGIFGMPPVDFVNMAENDFEISYFSPLALAAQRSRVNGTMAAIENILPLAEASPGIFDLVNFDNLCRDTLQVFGAHPDHIRSKSEVEKMRNSRNQAQTQAQTQAAALDLAGKQNLTAPVDKNSIIGGLM